MNFKSLLDKIIDKGRLVLTQPTMLFVDKEDIGIDGTHVVVADEVGRIDLIALEHYNSEEHIDYLLKFNGISDPLGINEGDILKIPSLGPNYKKLERPATAIDNIVRQEFVDGKRLTKKDKRRTDFLKKKYKLKEVLPPNVLKSGFKTFKFTEKNGEKATEMGMGASTPDRTYKPKNTSSTAKSLGSAYDDSWKKVDSRILDKDMESLTLKDVNTLGKAGITLEKFESAKDAKKKDDLKKKKDLNNGVTNGTIDSTSSKDLVDENGNYIGKESTVKTTSIDSGKKTTTVTTTVIRPDGSSTSTQTQTFEMATDEEIGNTASNSGNSNKTEKGLEDSLSNKKKENEKRAAKYNSSSKEKRINPDEDGGSR